MTTAHRPTFEPARGGTGRNETDLSKLSQQYSSKDMPSHKTLKYRQPGQAHPDEIKHKDLRRELEDREHSSKDKDRDRRRSEKEADLAPAHKKLRVEPQPMGNADADDPLDEIESDEDEDDDDDEAELMAELERIKQERAAERSKKDEEEREERDRIRQENILYGNPLLNPDAQADFKVKRRWDDDVVFKNCAKGLDERKKQPSFINDAIRSEFHKKFMEKYIK